MEKVRDGSDVAHAIIIEADTNVAGVQVEYRFLEERFGKRGVDWNTETQFLCSAENGEIVDKLVIRKADASTVVVCFEIAGSSALATTVKCDSNHAVVSLR